MRELAGKAAFVSGAASGIGLALATAFAGEGMSHFSNRHDLCGLRL